MSNTKIRTLSDLRKVEALERKAAGITAPRAPALPIVRALDTPVAPPVAAPNGGSTHVSMMEGATNVTISRGAKLINAAGPLRRRGKKIVTGTPNDEEAPDEIKVESFKNATDVTIMDSMVETFMVGGGKARPGQKVEVRLGEGAKNLKYNEGAFVLNSNNYIIEPEDSDSE